MPHSDDASRAIYVGAPRFVVLRHTGFGEDHFDLMFEQMTNAASLVTFRAPNWPVLPGDVLSRIGDHRPRYLAYQGPISAGRGVVARVSCGLVQLSTFDPSEIQLQLQYESHKCLHTMQLQLWHLADEDWAAQIALLTSKAIE